MIFTEARLREMGMPSPVMPFFMVTFTAESKADDMGLQWFDSLDALISAVRALNPDKLFIRTAGPDADIHASDLMRRCLPADHPAMQPIAQVLTRQHFVDDGACPVQMPVDHQFLVIIGSPVPNGSQPASVSKAWAPSIELAAGFLQGIRGDQIEIKAGNGEDAAAILAQLRTIHAGAKWLIH